MGSDRDVKSVSRDYSGPDIVVVRCFSITDVFTENHKKLVVVKGNLDQIPREKLKKQKGEDGKWYYKIDLEMVMVRNMAKLTFKLVHDQKEYGAIDAEWDIT